jgi:3-methyladenine DNA glycosylase AlkD
MEYLIDNPEIEKTYQKILRAILSMQNGITADSMTSRGILYEKNWGVSVVDLKSYASNFERNHLLALKLWNKQWRETMIMATLLDNPSEITEEQMDYWVKTSENSEIIEYAVANLFWQSPYAFAKAAEWSIGKKHLVKYAGLMLWGRLALTAKNAIDEMFEPFFEMLPLLAKDAALFTPIFRSVCQVARRNAAMLNMSESFANQLCAEENENAQKIGNELIEEFKSGFYTNA